jgi:iron complex outermembrane receptor protein
MGLLIALPLCGWPQAAAQTDLSEASLQDLLNMHVTTVSKKKEKLSRTAAAVYVITAEDIRRSGARSIPDLLRMVPGLEVAQINANTWAISARGFNVQIANKLLVLIDGRTVYDPSNSGVYWDVQDTALDDIARIEIIRGPGATIWGTNAVNGVINIITKDAADTQGGYLESGGGPVEEGFATLRYGGKIGEHAHYRVFGKYFNRASFDRVSGQDAADGWKIERGGFRTDCDVSDRTSVTLEGDVYGGAVGQPYPAPPMLEPNVVGAPYTAIKDLGGGDLLARWNHTLRGGSQMSRYRLQLPGGVDLQ